MALALGALTGGACGLLNGALVAAGVTPLVVTLATRELFRGVAMTLSQGRRLELFEVAGQGALAGRLLGLPMALWAMAGLALATYVAVHHTRFGRALFAMGDNERAARFAGVPVARVKLGLYGSAGLVAGLCGAALVLRFGVADAEAERSVELLAISCVVMGGVRVTGGAGHVGGVVVGAVTVCALLAGLGNVASDWRDTVAGAVLIGMALTTEAAARWLERQPLEQGAG
jgi:ribose/xylose/arabinose/galactoside ABC-type transport system permease subunit